MNGDILFRTMAFGGFNKEDVLEYISGLNQQIAESQKRLKEKDRLIQDAKRREDALKQQLSERGDSADEYFDLSEQYKKKIFELEGEVESLNKTISNIEVDFERTKDVEGQIGALVIDALLYSDKIIQSAKSSVKEISNDTKAELKKAVTGFDELGSDITQISDSFENVVSSLAQKLNLLSSNLTNVADSLDETQANIESKHATFSESTQACLPKLSEKDFDKDAEDDGDITQDDIDKLINELNLDKINIYDEKSSRQEYAADVEIPQHTEAKNNPAPKSFVTVDDLNIDHLLSDDRKNEPLKDDSAEKKSRKSNIYIDDNSGNENISELMNKFLKTDN